MPGACDSCCRARLQEIRLVRGKKSAVAVKRGRIVLMLSLCAKAFARHLFAAHRGPLSAGRHAIYCPLCALTSASHSQGCCGLGPSAALGAHRHTPAAILAMPCVAWCAAPSPRLHAVRPQGGPAGQAAVCIVFLGCSISSDRFDAVASAPSCETRCSCESAPRMRSFLVRHVALAHT